MNKKDVLARLAANVNQIHKLVKDAAAREDIDLLEILDSYLTTAVEDAQDSRARIGTW